MAKRQFTYDFPRPSVTVDIVVVTKETRPRVLLICRKKPPHQGTWALPGGTLEWGETFRQLIARELLEEAGVKVRSIGRLVGVFSRPDRDVRFHGVTVVVTCEVELPSQAPANHLEIEEVGLFADSELPSEMGMGTGDMLQAARQPGLVPVLE